MGLTYWDGEFCQWKPHASLVVMTLSLMAHSPRIEEEPAFYILYFQASLVVYELACKLNRDCNDLLWLAISGLTEQLLHEKIDR